MIAPLPAVRPPATITLPDVASSGSASGEFRDLLANSIASVEAQQNNAQVAVNNFLSGESGELHSVAIAGQKAELSLQLFMQVRNKVVSAYQEIMRMQM